MVIADTSIWIEFLKNNEPYFSKLLGLFEENQVLGIECVFGELLQGALNNQEIDMIKEFWGNVPKINESGAFIKAGEESSKNKWIKKGVGLIDSVIITLARATRSKVWTLDKKLNDILMKNEVYSY